MYGNTKLEILPILCVCEKPNWVQNLTVQFAKSSHYFPLHMCTRQQHSRIFWWSHLQEKNRDLRTTYAMILSQLMLRLCSMPSDPPTTRATEIVWDRSFKVCLHITFLARVPYYVLFIVIRITERKWVHYLFCPFFTLSPLTQCLTLTVVTEGTWAKNVRCKQTFNFKHTKLWDVLTINLWTRKHVTSTPN